MSGGHHEGQTNQAGSSTIGHYELKKTLGKGNFATVKLAQHKITNHLVAIKIVKFSDLAEDNLLKINREIDVLKKLGRHDHIVRLYQVIKTKRYFFLVTEYCKNGELYEFLVSKGRLNERQSCNYFLQILSAVEYLHDHNIVHRDLKVENLLLTNDYKTVKIADFGFANYFKKDNLLSTWCGSPPYAAPELFKGLHYVGPRVDIWSMGIILYVLVCGSLPFDGQNLVHLKNRVLGGRFRVPFFMTTECEGLIRSMLRLDPEKRCSIKHIRAHAWIKRFSDDQLSLEFSSGPFDVNIAPENENKTVGETTEIEDEITAETGSTSKSSPTKNIKKGAMMSSFNQLDRQATSDTAKKQHQIDSSRGQSLDMDESGDKVKGQRLVDNEDASMLYLNSNANSVGERVSSRMSNRSERRIQVGRNGASGDVQKKMSNLVNHEMANAVSNMSIDSNNSSMSVSQSVEAGNQSGCASSICSSRGGNEQTRTGSSGAHSVRQFSKESSIDDQIIDFMVDNLKLAEKQTSIREAIANNKYDDLHAIYKLLKDQPEMVLEAARFKIPSLPLISPNRDNASKKPSITTGFFNLNEVNTRIDQRADMDEKMPALPHGEQLNSVPQEMQHVESSAHKPEEHIRPQQVVHLQSPMFEQQLSLLRHNNNMEGVDLSMSKSMNNQAGQRNPIDQVPIVPPQLFLTPPADSKNQDQMSQISADPQARFDMSNQLMRDDKCNDDIGSASRHFVARHSFDSTFNQSSSHNEMTINCNLANRGVWDSSLLDSQINSMTPTTPVMLRDEGSASTSSSDNHGENPMQLIQNLAKITTNLPQIGAQANNLVNCTNLLLAQLNSSACTAAMTQSGLLSHQHDQQHELRFQPTGPMKFTPNNLVNQNYNNINTMQATLKNISIPNSSLLDPEGLMSGLERRASDGQASYNSLTACLSHHDRNLVQQQDYRFEGASQHHEPQASAEFSLLSNSSSPISVNSTVYSQNTHFSSLVNHSFQSDMQHHRYQPQHQYMHQTQASCLDDYISNGANIQVSGNQISNLDSSQVSDDSNARPLDLSNKRECIRR